MAKEKCKILIVEDEPDTREYAQRYFENRGFIVSSTASGIEALSMIKDSQPDIVFLDINLPDANGIELLEKLRKYDRQTKIVMVSGQLSPEKIKRIAELGVSGWRQKPTNLHELEELIHKVFEDEGSEIVLEKAEPRIIRKSSNSIVHELSNILGIIRNKCENFTMNVEEGIYKDKTDGELVKMSVEIMKEIDQTIDRAAQVVQQIEEE